MGQNGWTLIQLNEEDEQFTKLKHAYFELIIPQDTSMRAYLHPAVRRYKLNPNGWGSECLYGLVIVTLKYCISFVTMSFSIAKENLARWHICWSNDHYVN